MGPRAKRWLLSFIAATLAFGVGIVLAWLIGGGRGTERDSSMREVKLLQLEALVAGAVVDARRGSYESARQASSEFFALLRGEFDLGPRSALRPAQRNALRPVLGQRDSLITLLARGDPASVERLTEVYLHCRRSFRSR